MKIILLIFLMTACSSTCTMQRESKFDEAPKAKDEWPAEMPEMWVYEKQLKEGICQEQILAEIKSAYPGDESESKIQAHGFYKNGLYIHLEDSKENIIQKFKDKPWFSANRLRRPLIGQPC